MIDKLIMVVGILGSLAMVVAAVLDRRSVVVAIGLAFLFVMPVGLTRFSSDSVSGVAQSHPELSTFAVAAYVFAAMAWRYGDRQRLPIPLVLFVVYLAVGMLAMWDSSPLEWSGVAQYLLAPAGWLAGTFLVNFARESFTQKRFLALALLVAVSLESGLALLQISGVNIHRGSAAAQLELGWRVSGTLDHPNTLGKLAFIAILIFLPLSRQASVLVARASLAGIVLCFLLLPLSGGRANFLAALAAVFLWAVLLPRARTGIPRSIHLTVVGVFGVVAFLTLGGRFEEDPTGGSRLNLLDDALSVLPRFFWEGMGPNDYLTVMARIDPKFATSGLPVHNSFLLVLIELGVVGAVLLFLPWVVTFVRGCDKLFRHRLNLDYYRLAVCAFLPVALIAFTGKGMVADGILPMWFLIVGMCAQGAANDERAIVGPWAMVPDSVTPTRQWLATTASRFRR